jgi:hypothetical protein
MAASVGACGKKGPPLPPLIRLPAAPTDLVVERRGSSVEVALVTPGANTDGTRPADIERVDVYAFTGPVTVPDDNVFKEGERVASLEVKRPRDPDDTVDPDDPDEDLEPLEGPGADQGALVHLTEELDAGTMVPKGSSPSAPRSSDGPLLGPPLRPPVRTYVAVGVSTRGRRGPPSPRARIPLAPTPPAPASPDVTYDEKAVRVTWTAPESAAKDEGGEPVLQSRPLGMNRPKRVYNVYAIDRPSQEAQAGSPPDSGTARPSGFAPTSVETRLTKTPVDGVEYRDEGLEWGKERCYTVRTVHVYETLAVESEAPVPVCRTFVDTFPPAPPAGLQALASEGAVSLIWDRNEEPDLAGYIVWRGASADAMAELTAAPIEETTFRDEVARGVRYVYAVQAVDKARNASALSRSVQEAAR